MWGVGDGGGCSVGGLLAIQCPGKKKLSIDLKISYWVWNASKLIWKFNDKSFKNSLIIVNIKSACVKESVPKLV